MQTVDPDLMLCSGLGLQCLPVSLWDARHFSSFQGDKPPTLISFYYVVLSLLHHSSNDKSLVLIFSRLSKPVFFLVFSWSHAEFTHRVVNPCPAEPGKTCFCKQCRSRSDQLVKKPADLDLHCFPFSIQIYVSNLDQVT